MGYGWNSDLTVQKVNSYLVEMWKETKNGQFKVVFTHLYGQWKERLHQDSQSYSKSLLRMIHTHNFSVIMTDSNAPISPHVQTTTQ
jgi:hypothetical protein